MFNVRPTRPGDTGSLAVIQKLVRALTPLVAVSLIAIPVVADGPVLQERVRLRLDTGSGVVNAELLAESGEVRTGLKVAPASVDGARPGGFQVIDKNTFANEKLRIELRSVSAASAEIIWTALDNAAHDFVIAIEDTSNYYGCGERFTSLNHKGLILPMVSIDRPEDKGVCTYKPVPFFMSTRGYAAWLDHSSAGTFDLNATDRDHVLLKYRAPRLRLVLIAGPDPAAMLSEFTRLTGRPRVPPAWSFAPWKSRNIHNNRNEVLADAELTRRHDLPGSVIVIDSPWETGYNDFQLNEKQFTEPDAMFGHLRKLGFHTCLWLTPMINIENLQDMPGIDKGPSRNFAEAEKRGYLVKQPDGKPMIVDWWKGRGGLVDFTNPAAVNWWHSQIDQASRWGFRALKCDDGEGNFVKDAVFHDGTSAAEMKNRYAALYLQAAQGYIDKHLSGDGVLFARCGFTGTGAQPFCWAGDNEASFSFENGLPTAILAGQNAALSGLPFWGHDIAGYIGTPDKELFIRWTQFGALSPLMQVHMTSNLGPWDFDQQTLDIYRTFAKLHTSLFPYLYDAAHEAAEKGMPIIRPMFLAFPNDPAAAAHRYQYMLGPDLLVAPMYQPGTHRSVYLPKTTDAAPWIDYWTGTRCPGGYVYEVHAPLERMPLFVRGGTLICGLPDDVDTLIARNPEMPEDVITMDDRRIVQLWPGAFRELQTNEGIQVKVRDGFMQSVEIASTAPRSIEVRVMFVDKLGSLTQSGRLGPWTYDPRTESLVQTIAAGTKPATLNWPGGLAAALSIFQIQYTEALRH